MTTPNEELRKQLQQIYKSGELYYRGISDTTDLLQSQAAHIATLEGDVEYLQKDIDAMCNAIPDYRWSGGAAELIAKCFAERDELRAQLAAIAATEPVSLATDQTDEFGEVIYREVFTRPMPAQDVEASMIKLLDENFALRAELADMAVNTATYEHLVGLANDTATRLLKERDELRAELAAIAATEPVLVVEKEPDYWSGGHFHEGSIPHIKPTKVWCLPIGTKLFTRPMPAQDVTELVEALEALIESTTGVDQVSVVNDARTALSKYKGAKA